MPKWLALAGGVALAISVDQYIHSDSPTEKTTLRRQLDALFDTFDDSELTIIAGTAQGICKIKEPED